MKIAMVAGVSPWAAKAGGIRSYVLGLGAAMSKLGHEVTILGLGKATSGEEMSPGLVFRSLAMKTDSSSFQFLLTLVRQAKHVPIADHVLHTQRPDDLVPFMFRQDIAGRVLTVHGSPEQGIKERHGIVVSGAYRFLEALAFKTMDRAIVLDSGTERDLRTKYPKSASRIVHGTGGVDLRKFQPQSRDDARDMLGMEKLPTIAYVGRLEIEKNVGLLLAAFRHVSGAQLVIAGGGSGFSAIERQVRGSPEVRLLGPVTYESIPLVLNAADVVALPSVRESMPAVCLESLACGTPVVATRVGALPDLIEEGVTGFLSDQNEEAFAAKLSIALDCSSSMRAACRTSVSNFGWDRVAQDVLRIYGEVS